MKTVFLFLKNSLFISDLLRTNYIKYLAEKYRVVIFSNVIAEELVKKSEYFSSPNVIYLPWKVHNSRLFAIFKFLRTACMRELKNLAGMRIYYQSVMFRQDKRARLLRWFTAPLAPLLTIDNFTRLEHLLVRVPRLFKEYCQEYKPSLIITPTPGIQVFDAEAIILAKKMGIPTLAANFSWDNLTAFKAVRIRKPDYLFVWNDIIREAAVKIHHFKPEKVLVTGSMRFDRYFGDAYKIQDREKFLQSKNLDPRHPTLLFATVGQKGLFDLVVIREILELRNAGAIPYVNLLIRLHPFDHLENYREFIGLKNVRVELAGKPVLDASGQQKIEFDDDAFANLKASLMYTDININYKSTISLEAFLFDKPVINFIDATRPAQNQNYYDESSYYYPLVKYGAVRIAQNKPEMGELIKLYLNNPAIDSDNRRRVVDMFIPFRDGFSYKRSVDFLGKII